MPEQRPYFHIVPRGWDHAAWMGGFYPEDLPPDWRMTYFANEFDGVLIPQPDWVEAGTSRLEAWAEDVDARFRFFLEMKTPLDERDWHRRVNIFADTFGGLVADRRLLAGLSVSTDDWPRDSTIYAMYVTDNTVPHSNLLLSGGMGIAFAVPSGVYTEPRSQRRLLEQLTDQVPDTGVVLLILEGSPPAIEELRKLRVLAQLMGLA